MLDNVTKMSKILARKFAPRLKYYLLYSSSISVYTIVFSHDKSFARFVIAIGYQAFLSAGRIYMPAGSFSIGLRVRFTHFCIVHSGHKKGHETKYKNHTNTYYTNSLLKAGLRTKTFHY
ncbi:hypothetical protein LLH06_13020 [Mucilaginibacter daejeonensis]|jgi:hypothetical protein|uniref:hypothetical protein n=1 Tax=Mucilaginibacter daejeonensis TaxID=398049 RepID=UPI001D171CC9|nr:hypothetical protein [Mucilaginibacter daejeonensis]UEG51884.1 hypothetical protein LLH06_13020 [Mucilaginibacter daejeonensis]